MELLLGAPRLCDYLRGSIQDFLRLARILSGKAAAQR